VNVVLGSRLPARSVSWFGLAGGVYVGAFAAWTARAFVPSVPSVIVSVFVEESHPMVDDVNVVVPLT